MLKTVLIVLSLLSLLGCSKEEDYSDKLVEIYARVELLPPTESAHYIKQYGLDDEDNRQKYYDMLRELSADKEKWQEFLEKVDEYKRNVIDVEKQRKNKQDR